MNLVKEFLLLKAKVDKLYCQLIANTSAEQNSSVPNHVKNIKQEDIDNWNKVEDAEVQITEDTYFTEIGQNQKDFNKNVSDYKVIIDNKNIEQDGRIENLEGLNYIWSPTNRTLTLFDKEGNQLSQVSLVSLDDEGTSLKYNDITLSLELYNEADELLTSIPVSSFIGSVGTQLHLSTNQLQLKDSQGNILSTVSFTVSNIQDLQTVLDSKLEKGTYTGTAQDLKNEIDNIQVGGVYTSNLVPYTGANKDVNIASNYFKTSKGFAFTKDADNYFRTFHNGNYNYLQFSSLDTSGDNYGKVLFGINPKQGFYISKSDSNSIERNYLLVKDDETYSTKEFVSDVGFRIRTGTATQALTANGGVFDLTTKLDKGTYIGTASDLKSLIDTKADLVSGKIPASQLPAYVDDILEFADLASFPATGESGKIYIAIDTNLTYRWGGLSYVVMSSSLALGETSSTAYRGDRGKIAYDHSQTNGNPHGTTKNDIGLGNVDNTSDLNKPISTATQTALDNKQNAIGYTPENVANKATDLLSPDNTKYPTTLAVVNETKKVTITVELISQLTTNFYAPNALRINSTALISGSGTLTLKVNDVAYTLGNLIPQGAKITAETTSSSVYNLISIYE